jgi:hypothetical protein
MAPELSSSTPSLQGGLRRDHRIVIRIIEARFPGFGEIDVFTTVRPVDFDKRDEGTHNDENGDPNSGKSRSKELLHKKRGFMIAKSHSMHSNGNDLHHVEKTPVLKVKEFVLWDHEFELDLSDHFQQLNGT